MLRSILTLALSMFLLAEASAQTAPAIVVTKTTKVTKASVRTAARKASASPSVTR